MERKKHIISDSLFTVIILIVVFLVNLFLVRQYNAKTMTPMIFVLGVFLVSWRTQGYICGIVSSLISVLAANPARTVSLLMNWGSATGCWSPRNDLHRILTKKR